MGREISRTLLNGSTINVVDNGDKTFTMRFVSIKDSKKPLVITDKIRPGTTIKTIADEIQEGMNRKYLSAFR